MEPAVRSELERVLASEVFARSERLSRFLKFTVEETLAGRADTLKEYTLGLEVFDRDASFDPRTDTTVRVHARRLRTALVEYYSGAGSQDPLAIEFPKGGYVPAFKPRPVLRARRGVGWKRAAAVAAGVALCAVLLWMVFGRSRPEPVHSVAVLAFADLSPARDQEYFCDGLAEEIINALSGVAHVVGRTSSFQFKGKNTDLRQIGRYLNVDAVLEGSVRKAGNRVRISAQLVKVSDGYRLWSAVFERELTDVFARPHRGGSLGTDVPAAEEQARALFPG